MTAPVYEGEILAGKYRVERLLGQGGMGVVVAARHIELDELVALKFLLPASLSEPEAVARFVREARAAVRIKSEHVARVHDVGQLATGAPYIVMEYLEGSDLGAVLRARGVLPISDVIDYVAQACEAIANAHALGIIHRDLKPSNLMLVRRSDGSECVKVLDFGISKIASRGGADSAMSMTRTAASLGSPIYMSPEQMMSARDVDGRTDIWALGTILYELLAGRPPFVADTLPALAVLIATSQPNLLRALRPEIPAGIEAVASRCLEKQRESRFANVADLAEALAPFAPPRAHLSIERASRIVRGSRAPTETPQFAPASGKTANAADRLRLQPGSSGSDRWHATATASSWGQTAQGLTSRRKAATVVMGGVLVVAILAALLALFRRAPTEPIAVGAALVPPPTAVSNAASAVVATSSVPPQTLAVPPEPAPKALVPEAPAPEAPAPEAHEPAPPTAPLSVTRPPAHQPSRPAPVPARAPPRPKNPYEEM